MNRRAASALDRLEEIYARYGGEAADEKRDLLARLAGSRLSSARSLHRLHEILCFLRAYPDDAPLLGVVEEMLRLFSRRSDLRRHRRALNDSGIAGTTIGYRFFQPTASWLARRWGERITLDWAQFKNRRTLERWLPLLTHYAETPGLDEYAFDAREWIRRLKGPDETDAAFVIRRFDALRVDPFAREKLYDELDPPVRLAPGPATPSRTAAWIGLGPPAFQLGPLRLGRPSLAREIRKPPRSIRNVPPRQARAIIDLAREAMVTRSRDLDVFCHADPADVRLIDCGGGLQFAAMGVKAERRLLLEAVYAFLTLKNGVPIGYVLCSALFNSSEVAYNVFETYRGAESSHVYGRVLASLRVMFGSNAFAVDPYQVGRGNEEALRSGAWWFYQKLGFEPAEAEAVRLMRRELGRMEASRSHRSTLATLRRLAQHHLYYYSRRPREDVLGRLSLADVGLRISRFLAETFGSDRERAARNCSSEAARRLGIRSTSGFSPGERLAWHRWAPLVMVLPGLERWTAAQKRALAGVIRAKGGPRESDFVRLFDRHARLRAAIRTLAREEDD